MKTARLPRWVAAAALFALGALMAWWISGRLAARPFTMPDGSEVTLLGTTHGMGHSFSTGKHWAKLVRRFVSPGRARQLGLREYRHVTDKPALLFWTYWRFSSTNEFRLFASLRDRHGVESEPGSPVVFSPTPGRREALIAWQFKSFPARQEELMLRFYERDAAYRAVLVAGMPVPNPVRGPFPDWPATRPPVSVQQDGIEFTLREWRSGVPAPRHRQPTGGSVAPWNFALFEVRTNGSVDGAWRVRRVEAVGATGNSFSFAGPEHLLRGDRITTEFATALWPDEPAWKLNVEFSRTDHFGSDEIWALRAIPIRPGGLTIRSNLSATAQGVTLTDLEIGTLPPMQIRVGKGSPNMEVKLRFTFPPPGMRVDLLRAVDNRGRELSHDDGLQIPSSTYSARFYAYPDSETVDLTFAVHPSRFVEFLARPTLVTNPPSVLPSRANAGTNSPR